MFKAIAYNTGVNFVAKIIATFLGLAAVAMMTRYLGTIGFGQYTTVITYLQFFGILADLGLTLITAQLLAKYPEQDNKIISNLFTLRFFSALIFLGLAPLVVLFFPYGATIKLGILIATISFFCIALNQIFVGLYQKKLMMMKASLAEVGSRVILVAGVALAIYLNSGLIGVVVATVSAAVANLIINYLFSLKLVKIRFAFDKQIWREIISLSWPIAITITFNLIYLKADILILSLIKDPSEVGLYGAAYRVIDILVTLPFILAGIVLPQITAAWHQKNLTQFKELIQKSFDIMVIIALPLVIGTQLVADPLMKFVAGTEFAASGVILQLLIVAAGIIYLGTIFSHVIIAIEKQKQTIWVYILTATTALAGYLIFIPKYSYFGAAAVTIYSEILVAILIGSIYFYYVRFLPKLTIAFKSLIASIAMAGAIYYLNLTLIPSLIMAVLIYTGILYIISKNNLKQIIR